MNHTEALQAALRVSASHYSWALSVDEMLEVRLEATAVVRAYLQARAEGETTIPDNVLDEYPDFMMARCLLADFGTTTRSPSSSDADDPSTPW